MLSKTIFRTTILVASLSLLGACNQTSANSEDRNQAVMDTYSLSSIEAKAFQTCQSQMRRADFKPRSGVTMTRVPAEICACHAPMMVEHFKPGEGSEHSKVLAYVAGSSTRTTLDPNSLIDPNRPSQQFMALAQNLNSCAANTAQKNNNATKVKIEDMCEQGKLDAKRCRKILADLN